MIALATLLIIAPSTALGGDKVRYKTNTVVDFEETTVEGKSRKPYSAYLFEQQNPDTEDLANWQPDLNKQIELAAEKLEN